MDRILGRGLLRDCHVAALLAMTKRLCVRVQGFFKVVEINHLLVLSLPKDGRRWFDKLTMSGKCVSVENRETWCAGTGR